MSKKRRRTSYRLTRAGVVVLTGAALFVAFLWLHFSGRGVELPKTALLRSRNDEWVSQLARIDSRMDRCERTLEDLQERDEQVYRALYGMDSIPRTLRDAGFYGSARYSWMGPQQGDTPLEKVTLRLDRLTKKAYIQSLSYDEVETFARQAGDMVTHIPAICPLSTEPSSFNLSSPFGYRSDPINGVQKLHAGMDFACKPGNPVYATGDGVVVTASNEFFGYGNIVVIDHGFGYKSRYAHLQRIETYEGAVVTRGTQIGTTGSSGRVTGPHLHYEILYKGNFVNPYGFMDMTLSPEDYREMVGKAGGRL